MENSLISVIIPIYNVQDYLRRCLDSIINQSYKNLEIILVNDGSLDNCGTICDEYEKVDERIKVIHKKNGGLSDARNAGLEIATGDYIGFVDSDDYITEDMYEFLLHNMEEENADISVCGYAIVNDRGIVSKNLSAQKYVYDNKEAMRLLLGNRIKNYYWNKLYKKEFFDNFRLPVGKAFEDTYTMHLLFANANTIVYQDCSKYYYYMSPTSIIRGGFRHNQMDELEATRQRVSFAKAQYPEFYNIAKIEHARCAFYLFCKIVKSDHKKFSEEYDMVYQEMKNYCKNEIAISELVVRERILITFFLMNKYVSTFLYRWYINVIKPLTGRE